MGLTFRVVLLTASGDPLNIDVHRGLRQGQFPVLALAARTS